MEEIIRRSTLPGTGIWTIEDLAKYLVMDKQQLLQKLSNNNIPVLHLSNRAKHKLIRMEDLKPKPAEGVK